MMAVIYMRHPVHGNKVATMEAEAIFDEQNGWERYTSHTPSEPETASLEDAAPNEMMTRRGRPRRVATEGV
jgi:hypothetical protein